MAFEICTFTTNSYNLLALRNKFTETYDPEYMQISQNVGKGSFLLITRGTLGIYVLSQNIEFVHYVIYKRLKLKCTFLFDCSCYENVREPWLQQIRESYDDLKYFECS